MLHAADLRKTRNITNKPDVVRSRLSCGWSVSREAGAPLLSLPHVTWLFRGAVWGPRHLLRVPAGSAASEPSPRGGQASLALWWLESQQW